MSTKWERVTGKLYYFSCSQSEKVQLQNSTILPVYEVEKFNWTTLWYFMPKKWKPLAGELYYSLCSQSGKF